MRIIGGRHRGRQLLGPPRGAATRPTSDKVREALFNVLADDIAGARVLDLFAGTGAFGLEALSRGAAHATFVEADRALCDVIARNVATLGVDAAVTLLRRDVRRAGAQLTPQGYDVVFIDPPYEKGLAREALAVLLARGALAPGARVLLEHASRETPELPREAEGALAFERTRVYGDTSVTCYIAAAPDDLAAPAAVTSPGEAMPRIAIYPGSFDPMTNGHLDVIKRSLCMFDKLVIAVAANIRKNPLFDQAERIALIREVLGDDARVEVDTFSGLLVEYAKSKGATAIVRGLRAVADFEYEFEMASMNRRLAPSVETVFLMTHESYFYVSSHLVKEVSALGGDIDAFVPPAVAARLKARLAKKP